jgi:hypothetical protein
MLTIIVELLADEKGTGKMNVIAAQGCECRCTGTLKRSLPSGMPVNGQLSSASDDAARAIFRKKVWMKRQTTIPDLG